MPIVLASCPDCGTLLEIDTFRAVVLTGTAETIWREVRRSYRAGSQINIREIADRTMIPRSTVYDTLKRLTIFGLVQRRKVRRYHHYYISPPLYLRSYLSRIAA